MQINIFPVYFSWICSRVYSPCSFCNSECTCSLSHLFSLKPWKLHHPWCQSSILSSHLLRIWSLQSTTHLKPRISAQFASLRKTCVLHAGLKQLKLPRSGYGFLHKSQVRKLNVCLGSIDLIWIDLLNSIELNPWIEFHWVQLGWIEI